MPFNNAILSRQNIYFKPIKIKLSFANWYFIVKEANRKFLDFFKKKTVTFELLSQLYNGIFTINCSSLIGGMDNPVTEMTTKI